VTGSTNRLIIAYRRENTRVIVGSRSTIAIYSWQSGKAFRLLEGRVDAAVAHQSKGTPMIWETPTTRAMVVGTEFSLAASTNASRLDVLEGAVNFESLGSGKSLQVNASHYAEVAPGIPFELRDMSHGYGSVLREIWFDVPNGHIRNLTRSPKFPVRPDLREYPATLAGLTNWPASSGVRLRAFLRAPVTGEYRFWIKGSDAAELSLGSNELPESSDLIASLNQSALGEWEKYPWQKSPPIRLIAGRKYYIEALFKEGSGHVSDAEVAWQPPAGTRELIPSRFLSPIDISSEGAKQ
jgi:hypothetical protein